MSVVGVDFQEALGDDQGDKGQGDEHLANAAAGGGGFVFHGWNLALWPDQAQRPEGRRRI